MQIITSKKFSVDWRDVLKGALVAGITAGVAMIGQALELWVDSPSFSIKDMNYALAIKAAFGAFASYLIKNYLSPSKVIAKVQPPETVEEVADKIKENV